jgi:hypothetical protein
LAIHIGKMTWCIIGHIVATLTLGSRPKLRGVARLRAKRKEAQESRQRHCKSAGQEEARESHHILPGVLENVREWTVTLPRQLPLWEMESRWTPETSESNCKGQTSMDCGVLYIIEKLLKRRCLKWARLTHLNIWNTSYGQKKGRKSNCQCDSRPQRVGNRPLFDVRFGSATWRWKALNESYNFASDCIAIQGLLAKLWGSKVPGVPFGAISRLPLGNPGKNNHLDVASMESCRLYHKGEGGGFPQVRAVVSLVCPCCPWLVLAPRVLQLCTNHFVWVVCKPVWVTKACQLFLVPSWSSNPPLYPSKGCELGSVLRLLLFRCFLLGFTFEPFEELGVRHTWSFHV